MNDPPIKKARLEIDRGRKNPGGNVQKSSCSVTVDAYDDDVAILPLTAMGVLPNAKVLAKQFVELMESSEDNCVAIIRLHGCDHWLSRHYVLFGIDALVPSADPGNLMEFRACLGYRWSIECGDPDSPTIKILMTESDDIRLGKVLDYFIEANFGEVKSVRRMKNSGVCVSWIESFRSCLGGDLSYLHVRKVFLELVDSMKNKYNKQDENKCVPFLTKKDFGLEMMAPSVSRCIPQPRPSPILPDQESRELSPSELYEATRTVGDEIRKYLKDHTWLNDPPPFDPGYNPEAHVPISDNDCDPDRIDRVVCCVLDKHLHDQSDGGCGLVVKIEDPFSPPFLRWFVFEQNKKRYMKGHSGKAARFVSYACAEAGKVFVTQKGENQVESLPFEACDTILQICFQKLVDILNDLVKTFCAGELRTYNHHKIDSILHNFGHGKC